MPTDNGNQFEPISEEELIELVLEAQREALEKERLERLSGRPTTKKQSQFVKLIVWLMSMMLAFSTFAVIFKIYSIPAIEFLKVSSRLSSQENIQEYKKSIVEISTGESKGTGFTISDDGYIVTNEHVIEDALSITVIFPEDGMYQADVVDSFPDIDLALLKVHGEQNFPHLPLEESYQFNQNEAVYFIGNPLYFTGIANEGNVLGPTLLSDWDKEVYMMKAPVYRGNSGSPVINEMGKVIGIVFATTKDGDHGRVGLFIPVELLHSKLKESESTLSF